MTNLKKEDAEREMTLVRQAEEDARDAIARIEVANVAARSAQYSDLISLYAPPLGTLRHKAEQIRVLSERAQSNYIEAINSIDRIDRKRFDAIDTGHIMAEQQAFDRLYGACLNLDNTLQEYEDDIAELRNALHSVCALDIDRNEQVVSDLIALRAVAAQKLLDLQKKVKELETNEMPDLEGCVIGGYVVTRQRSAGPGKLIMLCKRFQGNKGVPWMVRCASSAGGRDPKRLAVSAGEGCISKDQAVRTFESKQFSTFTCTYVSVRE